MASLRIRDLHKTYPNGQTALRGVDFEVEDGEFLILVGGSGCGKSTLLNIIAGLEAPTRGVVEMDGRSVNALPPRDRDIAMVFQSYALYPSMTVRENISFGLRVRKVPKSEREAIVARVSETLQVAHLLDRKPSQLSGGQRQRVAMGRALARDPVLFLFDEPLSNLDAQLRVEMRAEIKLMHQKLGTTICYVTHDQIEAMTLGDRIAVMRDGTVQQIDTPQRVYDSPANLFVAGFIGAPPMNCIPGRLIEAGGEVGFELDTGVQRCVLTLPFSGPDVRRHLQRDVVLGLRAERITANTSVDSLQVATVRIDVVEPTGADTHVFTTMNGTRVVSRLHPSDEPRAGETRRLAFDMSKAVLFEPGGARIA